MGTTDDKRSIPNLNARLSHPNPSIMSFFMMASNLVNGISTMYHYSV